jgi:hypothetical protein
VEPSRQASPNPVTVFGRSSPRHSCLDTQKAVSDESPDQSAPSLKMLTNELHPAIEPIGRNINNSRTTWFGRSSARESGAGPIPVAIGASRVGRRPPGADRRWVVALVGGRTESGSPPASGGSRFSMNHRATSGRSTRLYGLDGARISTSTGLWHSPDTAMRSLSRGVRLRAGPGQGLLGISMLARVRIVPCNGRVRRFGFGGPAGEQTRA